MDILQEKIKDKKLLLIIGPRLIKSEEHYIQMFNKINEICKKLDIDFIYKLTFNKMNNKILYDPQLMKGDDL